jgi:hypothetical protein
LENAQPEVNMPYEQERSIPILQKDEAAKARSQVILLCCFIYRPDLRLSFNRLAHTCIQQGNFHFDSTKGLVSSNPIFSILFPIPDREGDLSLKFIEFFHPTVQLTQLHVAASSCQDVFGVILTIFWGWFVWGWIRLERLQYST